MLKDFILISDTAYLQILSIIGTETFSVSMQNLFFKVGERIEIV